MEKEKELKWQEPKLEDLSLEKVEGGESGVPMCTDGSAAQGCSPGLAALSNCEVGTGGPTGPPEE